MREPVEWSVATRCRRGEATSGDLAVVAILPEGALVAAIDGLGHGAEAARAARKAGEVVRESPSQDLVLLAERCHSALRDTRGAAISLAFISPVKSTMTWLGVGNVEGRVLSGDPSAEAVEGLPCAWERRSRAPVAQRANRDARPCGPAMFSSWPPTGSRPPSADSLDISGSTQAITERILDSPLEAHRRRAW